MVPPPSASFPPLPSAIESALLRQLLHHLPTSVAVVAGPEHRLTFFNEQFQFLAGGRLQLALPLAVCLPESGAQGLLAILDEVLHAQQLHRSPEMRLGLIDPTTGQAAESEQYVDCTCRPVRDEHGYLQSISLSLNNVSAEVRARLGAAHQLAEQRAFYEMLLEEVPAGLVALDPEHRYLYANPVMGKRDSFWPALLGQTNAAVCAAGGYPPAVAAGRQYHFDQAVRERKQHIWEETAMGHHGIRHWLRCLRPVFYPDGSLHLVVSLALDTTARRRGEAWQQEQRQLIQRLLDAIPHPLSVTDARGGIPLANTAYAELVFRTAGRRRLFAQAPHLAPELEQLAHLAHAVRESGREATLAVAYPDDSGERHHYQVLMRPLPQPDGTTHLLTLSTDVTARPERQQAATGVQELPCSPAAV